MAAFSTIAAIGLGAAGIGSQVISSNKATKAVTEASNNSDATNRYIYDDTVRRNAFRTATGNQALGQLANLYGLGGSNVPINTGGSFGGFGGFGGQGGITYPQDARSGSFISGFGDNGFGNFGNFGNGGGFNPTAGTGIPQTPGVGGQGYGGQGAPQDGASPFQSFYDSPDYNLAFTEGQDAIEGGAAARGGLLSGDTAKSVIGFGQNLANTTFGNYKNTLSNIAGVGQTADNTITNAGQNYANQFGNNQFNVANARAQGANNIGNTIGGLAGFGVGAIGQNQGWL